MATVNEQIFQYYPLKNGESFRLLRYLPDGGSSNLISCELVHVPSNDLPELPRYFALSYAWGDSTPRFTILVNGQVCHLPQSSFELLESLHGVETFLWIDTICIDQANLAEKA